MKKYSHLYIEDRTIIDSLIKISYSCKMIALNLNRTESKAEEKLLIIDTEPYRTFLTIQIHGFSNAPPSFLISLIIAERKTEEKYSDTITKHKSLKQIMNSIFFSRIGIQASNSYLKNIDETIILGLVNNQPLNHILHANQLPLSLSTAYRWIIDGVFTSKIIHLQKAVRYKRKQSTTTQSSNTTNRATRTYVDYLNYITDNPGINIIGMDIVERLRSDKKCILTFACIKSNLLFSKLLSIQTNSEVVDALNQLELKLGFKLFKRIFGVILTDNGSEFNDA